MATRLLFSVPYFIFFMGFFSNSFFLVYKYESSSSSMSHAVLKTEKEAASPGRQACAVRQQGRRTRCRALQWAYLESKLHWALPWLCELARYGPCLGCVCEMGLKGPRSEACWEEEMRQLTKWGQRRGTLEM